MKILYVNHFILFAVFALVGISCGVDETVKYDKDKTFGLSQEDEQTPGGAPDLGPLPESGPGSTIDDSIDPDTPIFKGYFQVIMDIKSLRVLSNVKSSRLGQESNPMKTKVGALLNFILKPDQTSDVIAEQTYGDGVRSRFVQRVNSAMEDSVASKYIDDMNDSGELVSYRVVGEKCGGPVFCVDKLVFRPANGSAAVTACYYDAETGEVGAIPNGLSPNFAYKDIVPYFQTRYGNFDVLRFSGEVDCAHPDSEPLSKATITVNYEPEVARVKRYLQKPELLPVQYAVRLRVKPLRSGQIADARSAPYVDQLTMMQSDTVYYINEDTRQFVKMVKTIRKPIKPYLVKRDDRAWYNPIGWWGVKDVYESLTDLVKYDGIQLKYHIEFCEDHLKPGSPNYCK